MRIAFLTDTYWPRINGVTVSTDVFVKQLRSLGHQVELWAPDYSSATSPTSPEPGLHRFRSLTPFFSVEDRLPHPGHRRKLYAELDAFAPDLIHVQTEVASLFIRSFARSRKVPVVQTCHTYFEQYIGYYFPALPTGPLKVFARWLTRRLVQTADALVCPTHAMKEVIESYGITLPISIVPTGIAEEDFGYKDKDAEKQTSFWLDRHPVLRNRRVLLCVGRVAQEKNVDFLLDMMDRVRASEPTALLVVAGSGPYLETFRGNLARRGLSEHVLCLGYVDRQDLRHLYTLAEVFTFASVTETQGLVTIEAMMCGTPAVAIGKMGTREVMAGDNGGFMVEEDVEAFAAAVLRLLQDPDLYRAKSAEALAYSQNWTASRMTRKIEALYQEVLTIP